MPVDLDAKSYGEIEAIVALAGRAAERLAKKAGESGVPRRLFPAQKIALHEAGHVIAGAACGRYPILATVEPHLSAAGTRLEHGTYGGLVVYSPPGNRAAIESGEDPAKRDWGPLTSDARIAARMCQLLAPDPGWKSTLAEVRRLRAISERLLESNWWFLKVLSAELQKHKTLDRGAIAKVLHISTT